MKRDSIKLAMEMNKKNYIYVWRYFTKITGIEIKQYAKPLDPPFLASWDPNPRVKFASTIVYVYTDEGITGIGSGDLMTGFAGPENYRQGSV